MSRETSLWRYMVKGMSNRWDASRHEDMLAPGVPDVSYGIGGLQGWIELKVLPEWPKKFNTPVRFPKLTPWQKHWLIKRGHFGGGTWLFVRIEKSYLLFHWRTLTTVGRSAVGQSNREELILKASGVWDGQVNWDEFADILKKKI